jgi:hypothetical protein
LTFQFLKFVFVDPSGILTTKERVVSADGIEIDLAVSSFSRQVLLKALAPRLTKPAIRVFVMGFPGNKVNINSSAKFCFFFFAAS